MYIVVLFLSLTTLSQSTFERGLNFFSDRNEPCLDNCIKNIDQEVTKFKKKLNKYSTLIRKNKNAQILEAADRCLASDQVCLDRSFIPTNNIKFPFVEKIFHNSNLKINEYSRLVLLHKMGFSYEDVYVPDTASLIKEFCSDKFEISTMIDECKVSDKFNIYQPIKTTDWNGKLAAARKYLGKPEYGINIYDYAKSLVVKSEFLGLELTNDERDVLDSYREMFVARLIRNGGTLYEPLLLFDAKLYKAQQCLEPVQFYASGAVNYVNPLDDPILGFVSGAYLGNLIRGMFAKSVFKKSSKVASKQLIKKTKNLVDFKNIDEINSLLKKKLPEINAQFLKVKSRLKKAGVNPDDTQLDEIYQKIYYRKLYAEEAGKVGRKNGKGGLAIIDHPTQLDILRPNGIVFDHHGKRFASSKNSGMQLLDHIEQALAKGESVESIKKSFRIFSTDNIADGLTWPSYIINNLDEVAGSKALRAKIYNASKYEDFGVFGTSMEKMAKNDTALKEAIELQKALYSDVDKMIKNSPDPLYFDRFNHLDSETQKKMYKATYSKVDTLLKDKEIRKELANKFDNEVREYASYISKSSKQVVEKFKGNKKIEELTEKIYVYDEDLIEPAVKSKLGTFAKAAAPSKSSSKEMILSFSKLSNEKTKFILAIPEGRVSKYSLQEISQALIDAEKKKLSDVVENSSVMTRVGASLTEDLAFSFEGVGLSKKEILEVIADQLK